MKVTVTFETKQLFTSEYQDAVTSYLRREINASEAAKRIGFTREQWNHYFAAIFAKGNSEIIVEEAQGAAS